MDLILMNSQNEATIPKTMLIKDFAKYSGLSEYFIRKNVKSGLIVSVRLDGKIRILVDKTMENLERNIVAPVQ